MFRNTPIKQHGEFGRTYAACGGETVTNLGLKTVKCLLTDDNSNNPIHKNFKLKSSSHILRQNLDSGSGAVRDGIRTTYFLS